MNSNSASSDKEFKLFSPRFISDGLVLSIESVIFDSSSESFSKELANYRVPQFSLLCKASSEQYQQIFCQDYLNLIAGPRKELKSQPFIQGSSVHLKIVLKSETLFQFVDLIDTPKKAITYLQSLSQTQDQNLIYIHPLLQEQNWYCTTIKQTQPNGEEIVHHTLWHYLLPTLQNPNPDNIANSITQYITDQTTDSLNQITQATDPLFQDIAQTFQDLFSQTLTDLDSTDPDSEDEPNEPDPPTLLTALTDFLDSEDWPHAQLPATSDNDPTTTLRLSFRGDNGQWPCYAKLNPQQQTLCFYSIAPITAQPDQQPATAEFITRANYGMILGNFELDYSDGEIRYKTSIDVEGDNLTPALIQNLVYTNVMTMDQYLPGLLAVLEQNATPQQAIALVEQGQAIPEPTSPNPQPAQTPATQPKAKPSSAKPVAPNPMERLVW